MLRIGAPLVLLAMLVCGWPAAAAANQEIPLGRLNWGATGSGEAWTASLLQARMAATDDDVGTTTAQVLKQAEATIQQPIQVVSAFHQQSVLFTQPEYQASHAAAAQLGHAVYPWAMCARVAAPPLSDSCRTRAAEAIDAWMGTYKPTGAPVDEANLIPLFQSIDLMLPLLRPDQQTAASSWLHNVIQHNDAYYAGVPSKSTSKTNNHASWSFALRAIESAVYGDSVEQAASQQLLAQQIARNIKPDGSTLDFGERDALHYQAYDLEPLLDALLFAPGAVDADGEAAILRGIQFLQPFVTGQQQHVEFVGSKVPFDAQRRQAGDATFANAPWQPSDASRLLLLAQAHFPAVRAWAGPAVQPEPDARLSQLAALQRVLS